MKVLNIGGKEYKMEFTFEAAECKDLVQKMFNLLSGAYIFKHVKENEQNTSMAMIDGTAEMISEIPHICKIAFYAGFLENQNSHGIITEESANDLMRSYMKETKISYSKLHEMIKEWMEEDGFFDLSGLTDMIQKLNESAEEQQETPKQPQDHKKKSTSTK